MFDLVYLNFFFLHFCVKEVLLLVLRNVNGAAC